MLTLYNDDTPLAQMQFEESLAIFRTIGDQRGIAEALLGLGLVAMRREDLHIARAQLDASLALYREIGVTSKIGRTLSYLGDFARATGDPAAARDFYVESLETLQQLRPSGSVLDALDGLSALAAESGHAARAAEQLGAAQSMRLKLGIARNPASQAQYSRDRATISVQLMAAAFTEATARGQALPLEEVVALALQPLDMATLPVAAKARAERSVAPEELNVREVEVLCLVAAGLSNQELAERLTVSIYAIQAHLRSIYGKLGVTSRSAATRYAWEHHLVLDLPPVVPNQERRLA